MRTALPAVLVLAGAPAAAGAAEMTLNLEIPRLSVAEYHRPYVAVWIEKPDQTAVTTLSALYDVKMPKNEGETWLKDVRQWWRRAGRALDLPMDGVSGPTRAPGKHQIVYSGARIGDLPAGQYAVVVEASREVGGREVLRLPFSWPAKAQSASAQGASELGDVSLTVKP